MSIIAAIRARSFGDENGNHGAGHLGFEEKRNL
jgi:hypothetical protein